MAFSILLKPALALLVGGIGYYEYDFSVDQVLLFLVLAYCGRIIYWELTVGKSRRRLARQHGCRPAHKWPAKDPILGIDSFLDSLAAYKEHRALEHTQHLFNSQNKRTGSTKFLNQQIIVTIEPKNVQCILSLDFKSYELGDQRKSVMVPFLGEGIFTTDGPAWQHSREMLRPNFVRAQLVEDLEMFERHLQHLMLGIPRDGSTVDLQDLFFGFTFDVATEFLFGESTNCLAPGIETESSAEFIKAFTYCQNTLEGAGDVGILGLFLPNKRFKRGCETVRRFADRLIEKAIAKQQISDAKTRMTFLQQLTAETNDKVRIRSELLNLLLAGRDSTAALLANAWFELARRPEIQARLRQEVHDIVGNDIPTFEQLKSLKYLRAIINEALRMYPIVPEESRQAVTDAVLPLGGGDDETCPVLIRKGQLVSWSVYTMHRRKDLYGEDAESFRPERWLDGEDGQGSKGLRVGWEYVPFNGGPRICIGQQFALTEATYATVRLLQEFGQLESRDSEPWRERMTMTCMSLGGCQVALTAEA